MPVLTIIGVLLTVAALAGLLAAERKEDASQRAITKPLASLGFLVAAVGADALSTQLGRAIMLGLVLSAVGDVCLLSLRKPLFLAGLGSFLLAHVCYAVGFYRWGVEVTVLATASVVLLVPAVAVWRWLSPRVPDDMRAPVAAYIVVISMMVGLAFGAAARGLPMLALVGALAFYASDISVAIDRFVDPHSRHRMWGLPLYYGAQLCLAVSLLMLTATT